MTDRRQTNLVFDVTCYGIYSQSSLAFNIAKIYCLRRVRRTGFRSYTISQAFVGFELKLGITVLVDDISGIDKWLTLKTLSGQTALQLYVQYIERYYYSRKNRMTFRFKCIWKP